MMSTFLSVRPDRAAHSCNAKFTSAVLLASFLGVVAGPAAAQSEAAAAAGGACTKTSEALRKSCRNATEAEYWRDVGSCQNRLNAKRTEACIESATEGRDEAQQLCGEQFDAREAACDAVGQERYSPKIDPKDFVKRIDNPFYPLIPGTRYTYKGETDEGVETVVISVTNKTETILGVECTVVRDTVTLKGEVIEDTIDWFAQDKAGNVWYFGEISKGYEDGDLVSLAGSWRAGVDGAKPGIVMPANPRVGNAFRQEFSAGIAEDYAIILNLAGKDSVPAASCNGDCVVTRDLVPLEPDANERKFYARGVGFILEVDEPTGARVELVKIEGP